jgi:hypothetical protein
MPPIDVAEIMSAILNNSEIQFKKLPVILIMFGSKKIYALEDLHWIKHELL